MKVRGVSSPGSLYFESDLCIGLVGSWTPEILLSSVTQPGQVPGVRAGDELPLLPGPLKCPVEGVLKVVRHARYVIFQMAEVAVPRKLFQAILDRISLFRVAVMDTG